MSGGDEPEARPQWGDKVRENARSYYEKFALRCCTAEEFTLWFRKAEGARTRCRLRRHFCDDCTPTFEAEQTAEGLCVKALSVPPERPLAA